MRTHSVLSTRRSIHSNATKNTAMTDTRLGEVLCRGMLTLSLLFASICGTPPPSIAQEKLESAQVVVDRATDSDTLVLISPLIGEYVYLVNAEGNILHQWQFDCTGNNAYLFPDGTVMRLAQTPEVDLFDARGSAGRIQKLDWDGNLLWDYILASQDELMHHDFELLPNGNVLFIVWERIEKDEVLAAGRDPSKLSQGELYSEKIVEVRPKGKSDGEIVWQWRLFDHLVQDLDESLPHFGKPSEHPRRVDINYMQNDRADWIHMNAVDYNAEWDQIILSPRHFDEFWVIDHSTTLEESATSRGGRYGHGGDLLYRCGNPMSYGQGTLEDKFLFGQHNCVWIPKGFPGEGNITLYNNGTSAPNRGFSSADEIKLPAQKDGTYRMISEHKFEPPERVWSYSRGPEMYSYRICGVERLQNGNTLVCSGHQSWIMEVTPDKRVVWENRHQYGGSDGNQPNREKGAMFRSPGYTLGYFEPSVRKQIEAAQKAD